MANADCSMIVSDTPGTSTMPSRSQLPAAKKLLALHVLVGAAPGCWVLFQMPARPLSVLVHGIPANSVHVSVCAMELPPTTPDQIPFV
jgi:hypothetical protein